MKKLIKRFFSPLYEKFPVMVIAGYLGWTWGDPESRSIISDALILILMIMLLIHAYSKIWMRARQSNNESYFTRDEE